MLFWTILCSGSIAFSQSNDSGYGDSNPFALDTSDTGAGGDGGFGDSNTFSLNTSDTGASGEAGFGDSNTFSLNTTDTGASGEAGFGDSNTFSLNTTDTGASGESGFGDSNTFSLKTTDTGASGEAGFGDSNTFSLNTTDTGASGEAGFGDSNTFSLNTTDTGASGESGFGDSNTFSLNTTDTGASGEAGFGDSNTFSLNTTDTGASGEAGFGDSNTFSLNTTDTGASGEAGFGDSNTFSLNTTDTGASGESGFGDSNTFSLNTTDTGASGEAGFGDSNTFSLNTTDTGASGEAGFGDSNTFSLNTTDTGASGEAGFGDSNTFSLNTTDTGASGEAGFGDSNTFSLNTTDTGASGGSGFGDSNTFSLNTTDTGASGGSGFGDSNTFSLNTTDTEQNATITGTVYYSGIVTGSAIVSAKDLNGTLFDHAILADGNGSYSLSVPIGGSYDFKAFVDGTNNFNLNPGEPFEHFGEWNATLSAFNPVFVDGNLSGVDFHLTDKDQDGDGYLDWTEVLAGSDPSDANSTPNQAPQFQTDGNLSVLENETLVYEFNATDANGDTLSYTIQSGLDAQLFELNATNGVLTFLTARDFENPEDNNTDNVYELTVSVSDGNASATLNVFVSVLDKYEPSKENHTVELNATVGLEMIWVEPGTFMMGSPETEANRSTDEIQHQVTLTRGFYLGKYEVTQAQYEAVMTGVTGDLNATPSLFADNHNRPVERVSWNDVQVFLDRLNERERNASRLPERWEYVLPTEAQWEYACRAGTNTAYSWGDGISPDNANYVDSGYSQTRDVGQYSANPWGFFDMHGNVYEWTLDWYAALNSDSKTDPLGPSSGTHWVIRGGSWQHSTGTVRSAYRSSRLNGFPYLGFRLAFKYIPNREPIDLNFTGSLAFNENLPIGTTLAEFNATDPDGDSLTYHLVDENGSTQNHLFTLEQNGTLKTAVLFDYEANASTYLIRVQAKDELNATIEKDFTLLLQDINNSTPLNDSNFMTAINLWFSNEGVAKDNYGHISDWNVSAVTNMANAFKDRSSFNEDIRHWDVSSVIDMSRMFNGASSFNQPIIDWNVSKVLNMSNMFYGASIFNQPIGNWNVSSLSNAAWMFHYSSFNQPISNWDVSSLVNMMGMFEGASSFNQDISDWNVSSVTIMSQLFKKAYAFNHSIANWNISGVTDMNDMFLEANAFSDENKGLIHATFSLNSNWPYDWSEFLPNETPQFETDGNLSVQENETLVFEFNATDADGDTLSYSIQSGLDAQFFELNATSGVLTFLTARDFENPEDNNTDNVYELTVSVSDGEANATLNVYVAIQDVDDTAPVITLLGDANITHEAGAEYVDAGAAWHDSVDGNGTADANGTVDHLVPGTYQITYSYTDSSGNAAQQIVRTVNVVDTTPPVISLIGDANVTHSASTAYIDQGANWTDIVDGNGTADANGSVDSNTPGIYQIIYNATDESGNAAEPVVRTINVVDSDAPVITMLGDANITHEAGAEYVDAGAQWNDSVDGNGTADANGTVDHLVPGIYQITYSYTDSSGNAAQEVTRTVHVVDTTPPVISLIGDANVTHSASTTYIDQGANWTDVVDGNGTADANGSVDSNTPGTYQITYSKTDAAGNTAEPVVRTIHVVDSDAPVITLLGDANITHEAGGLYTDAGANWHDSVDGNGTADANGTVDHLVPAAYQITYSFTDSSGNVAQEVVRTVNVVDTTPPVITLIGDANVTHSASNEYVDAGATWTDVVDGSGVAVASGTVDFNAPGIYQIIYNATDESGNAAEPVVRTIQVVDSDAPVITMLGDSNLTLEAGEIYTDLGAIWHDSLDGNGTADANGSVDHLVPGIYQINYTYVDSSGNAAQEVIRTIQVVDTTPPVISLIGDANLTHSASNEYVDAGATWTDMVDGSGVAVASGTVNFNAPGIYQIIYNATDESGNAAEPVVRTIQVVDNAAPVITLLGDSNLTLEAGEIYTDLGAIWHDSLDGNGTADANGTVDHLVPGTYQITYNYTDSSGNAAQQVVRTVNVVDTTPPVITLIGDANVTHLASSEYFDEGATWSDIVDGNGTADANGSVDSNTPGIYKIIYTKTDANGNAAEPVVRTVSVIQENRAPESMTLSQAYIAENLPENSLVGYFNAFDPDENDVLTYRFFSLDQSDNDTLEHNHSLPIDENSTDLEEFVYDSSEQSIDTTNDLPFILKENGTLLTARMLDYESDPKFFDLHVIVHDQKGASYEQTFVISLINIIEDMDGDGVEDAFDSDRDGDGINNEDEVLAGTDPDNQYSRTNKPIVNSDEGHMDENGTIHLSGEVLFNGDGQIKDFGFVLSSGLSLNRSKSTVYWVRGVGEPNQFSLKVTASPFPRVMYFRSWARNAAGYGIGPVKKVIIPEAPQLWWGEITEEVGGWKSSSWFGTFMYYEKGWLFHAQLGWLYSSGLDNQSVWLWTEHHGWLWTKEGVWPYLFKNDSASWIYFTTTQNGIPLFYDYLTSSYLGLEHQPVNQAE